MNNASTSKTASKPARTKEAAASPGWIDAHVHVWTEDVARYPLAPDFTSEQMQPRRFTPEELLKHCEPCGVKRINLIQMSYYGYDNSYVADDDNNEYGWAAMLAYKAELTEFAGLVVEIMHVSSDRPGRRLYGGIDADQGQTSIQSALRFGF